MRNKSNYGQLHGHLFIDAFTSLINERSDLEEVEISF